ncbi:MAG: hypothetical protein EGQ20_06295 [Bacteroides oleiciplenus]|jgi:hypothetical protein|nr:hypothetical protein [Bacteroides oleiciplenus]
MSIVYRNRTIRPSSRLETSVSYKINTEKVTVNDTLIVTVNHESENFTKEFTFSGNKIANRSSIHFKYTNGEIIWSTIQPD